MDITLDKQSTTDGLIKIKLTESDYQPKVEEKVKEYSRKANLKGFRAGKVPSGVIRKMFGKSILVEEVNHLISHSVSDFIREKNLRILGDPLPNQEKAGSIDWDTQKNFEFEFQVGMVGDFQYELSPKVKLKSNVIEVTEQVVQETIEEMKQRFGEVSYPEESSVNDNLFGTVTGATGEDRSTYIPIAKIDKKEQKKFVGLRKDDSVTFEVENLSKDKEVIARAINVSEEEAGDAKGTYTLKVSTISHVEPAEINQTLFDKVFGKDAVKTEDEFREKIQETISGNYKRETEHLLYHEVEHYYIDHTTVDMPESFLKTWMKATSEGKVTDDVLEKEFAAYRDSLKWDLIKNKIAEDLKITVESDEVKAKAREMIAEQFGGPNIAEQLGDRFDALVDNYLTGQDGKGQMFMRIYNQLRQEKVMKAIVEKATVTEKKVSLEEFKKIADSHKH